MSDSEQSKTENDYLELAKHSKDMYDKQNTIIVNQKEDIIQLKKDICTAYTFFKLIDNLVDEFIEDDRPDLYRHPLQIFTELAIEQFSEKLQEFLN